MVVTREPLTIQWAIVDTSHRCDWSPSNPSNTALRESHSGSGYKSPPEIPLVSPRPLSLTLNTNRLSQWYCTFRVLCMNYDRGSDHPSCYQQSSVVLVNNHEGCGVSSCSCGDRYAAQHRVRRVGRYADPSVQQLWMQAQRMQMLNVYAAVHRK